MNEKVKSHFEEHKEAYIAGVCGIALALGSYWFAKHRYGASTTIINNAIAPIFNNDNSAKLNNFGGYSHKLVKRLSDGKLWETVKEAAAEIGVDVPRLSRHLNGHIPHINEEIYSIIGLGTAA